MHNDDEISEMTVQVLSELMERIATEDSSWPNVLIPSIMVIVFVVSLVGNSVTCVVIYHDKSMHTLTNYYLFNLAVSDLLVTLAIPLVVYEEIYSNYALLHVWYGNTACKVHFFLIMALWNNCILIMTALAIERYLAICHPMSLKSTPVRRRVMKVIGVIWMIAIAEAAPETWDVQLIQSKSASMCICTPTRFYKIVNGVLAVVTFLIPLAVMTFVYTMIVFQINVVQKNMSKGRTFNQRNNRSKVNKLITLTVAFLVCWVPFFTVRICIVTWNTDTLIKLDKYWVYVWKACVLNIWFSAVLNPLLFSVISTKFRRSLKALWNKQVRRQQSPAPYLTTATRTTTYV